MNFQPLARAKPVLVTNSRPTYTGPNWSHSMLRPGCQDHLQYPSRRSEARVFHRGHVTTLHPMSSSK